MQIGDQVCTGRAEGDPTHNLTVVGFAKSPFLSVGQYHRHVGGLYNQDEVQKMDGVDGANQILVRLKDFSPGVREDTRTRSSACSTSATCSIGSYWERNPDDYVGKRQLDALVLLMTVFSLVGLTIASFLVANTLAAVISEQMGEIGADESGREPRRTKWSGCTWWRG